MLRASGRQSGCRRFRCEWAELCSEGRRRIQMRDAVLLELSISRQDGAKPCLESELTVGEWDRGVTVALRVDRVMFIFKPTFNLCILHSHLAFPDRFFTSRPPWPVPHELRLRNPLLPHAPPPRAGRASPPPSNPRRPSRGHPQEGRDEAMERTRVRVGARARRRLTSARSRHHRLSPRNR